MLSRISFYIILQSFALIVAFISDQSIIPVSQGIPMKMKAKESEPEAPLSLWPFVKMTAPVFLFGVILPFADIVTDLRMIIRLYIGVWSLGGGVEL